jgi:hypothetical protein
MSTLPLSFGVLSRIKIATSSVRGTPGNAIQVKPDLSAVVVNKTTGLTF